MASCSSDSSLGIQQQTDRCDKPRKIKSFENNNLSRENKNVQPGRKSLAALGRSNAVIKSPIVPAISLSTTNSLEQEENSGKCSTIFFREIDIYSCISQKFREISSAFSTMR